MPFGFAELEPGEHGIKIPTHPGKSCGSCTACCYSVPVKEIALLPYKRCQFLRLPFDKQIGCSIYDIRPRSCSNWSCVWLSSDLADELKPDRCGVVIDPLPDLVRVGGIEIPCAQFWALPGFEESWEKNPMKAAIGATLDQMDAILWRLPPPADGETVARLFMRDPDTRQLMASPPFPCSKQMGGFNTDGERLLRAQQLLQEEQL